MVDNSHHINYSIIIATRNREGVLWQTVQKAISAISQLPAEILIINDGQEFSQDKFENQNYKIYQNPNPGVAAARNFGAEQALGKWLLFLDDDMWLNAHAAAWINQSTPSLRPQTLYVLNWEYPPELTAQLGKSKIGRYLLRSSYHTLWGRMHGLGPVPKQGFSSSTQVASGSLLISKDTFAKLGGYNSNIPFQGEDIEMANRVLQAGMDIQFVFDVTLHHNQSDRLQLNHYLNRLGRGYASQFMAENNQLIPASPSSYSNRKNLALTMASKTERLWQWAFHLIPNVPILDGLSAWLIGALSGLEKFKQWRKHQNNPE